MAILSKSKDCLGLKFGRLTILSFVGMNKHRMDMWMCKCECGKAVITRGLSIRSGHTESCGCLKKKHGLSNTRTQYSWSDMKRRCTQKYHYQYKNYGAKGIRVCKRWLKFQNFVDDMGIRPEGTSLDRKDGKKGYSPNNCRWATPKEQILNRSITRWITFRGKTLCLSDWARTLGISSFALHWRIDIGKWPMKDALTRRGNPNIRLHQRA